MSTATAAKIDLYRLHKPEYITPKAPAFVKVGKAQYLSVEGRGAPGGAPFQDAIGALYSMAFTIKMARKFAGRDYAVAKLEAQYWLDSGHDFENEPRENWNWRLLIRVPEFIGKSDLDQARRTLAQRGKGGPVGNVKLYALAEGECVQALHTGPYSSEAETIAKMCERAAAESREFHGLHHEIYLSDPRRVAPEKLRTILRIPVRVRK